MVKLLVDEQEVKFETTIFPDGTSQVWKIQDGVEFDPHLGDPVILWLFENEAELFQVLQLAQLVQKHLCAETCTLRVPYLPYGRQDKVVDNKLSFALQTFKDVLYSVNICRIETFDPHSRSNMVYDDAHTGMPTVKSFHQSVLNHDVVCYPDKGAAERYKSGLDVPSIFCEKVRNQLTGEITGLKMVTNGQDLEGKTIAIIDDICDAGGTFIGIAKLLKEYNPSQIDLIVSHGLFSKGRQVIHDSGIVNIFTTNSLLRNPEGFKIW